METIIKLPENFIGSGEVKGFVFNKKTENEKAYIYEVSNIGSVYYEVFLKKNTPVCIDFENKIYSDEKFKEKYPKSNDFGIWAFCCLTYENAVLKFNKISK